MAEDNSSQRRRWLLLAAGMLAGFVTVAFTIVTRQLRGSDAPLDLLGDGVLQAVPVALFTFMLRTFQHTAKPLLLASVIAGVVLVGGLIGLMSAGTLRHGRWRHLPWRIVKLATGVWAPLIMLVIVIASYGTAVPMETPRLVRLALFLAGDALVFSAALHALAPLLAGPLRGESTRVDMDAPERDSSRRRLLQMAGAGAIAAASAGVTGSYLRDTYRAAPARRGGVIPEPITQVGDFYVISKNFSDPRLDESDWTLDIAGLVEQPLTLDYRDLLGMPAQHQLTTLTCISNQVGGDLISNASWGGVRLADLLLAAGLRSGGIKLAIYAHDGYTESMPLSKALESSTMLVHSMNGAPLIARHGFPARLIVPGKYGIKNVKWIRRIEVVAGDFRGYWQQRGWTDDATIQTMSRIDSPGSRAIVGLEPVTIGGVAYAGDRGIQRVEWSSDGGATWTDANGIEQVGPLSWVIWRSTWNPSRRGSHRLMVRATDGGGIVQPSQRRPPIPDGAHGYHAIDVGVA